jgi:putative monooxygenase
VRSLALAAAVVAAIACGGRGPGAAAGGGAAAAGDVDEAAGVDAIEKAMNELAVAAHLCWAAAAVDDYRVAGEVALLIEVDAAGTAAAQVRADTTGAPRLLDCLRAIAEGYRWAPPMHGGATLLPFAFTAPRGQHVIDRALIPEVEAGARVLLDRRNSGNGAASLFELVVPAGAAEPATASQRAELWIDLAGLDALYLPPGARRAPSAPADRPRRILVVSVPGGDEDGSRRAGVLPAAPAQGGPPPVALPRQDAARIERPGVGTVALLLDPARVTGAALSATLLDVEAGAVIPPHVHDGATELLYVLAGAGTMTVDGVELAIGATSVVQIPAGLEHAFTASEATRVIQLYAPPGPEQRFKQN